MNVYEILCDSGEMVVTAEEIEKYFYCPRMIFFRHIRKVPTIQSSLMDVGKEFHDKIVFAKKANKESKEILKVIAPHSKNTQQYHDIYLESKKMHLGARLDLFEKNESEIYPVEIKTGIQPVANRAIHHYMQLTAQALLLEEKFNLPVNKARVYYTISNDSVMIDIKLEMKLKVLRVTNNIRRMFLSEIIPNPTADVAKCSSCEYFPYCGRV